MDEERMLEWINKVWLPYVQGKPALLCLDTFTGHLTERVKAAFDECGTKLLVIPGGCTSILQPLDISINKPFKTYIRQSWCQYMIEESDKGVSKVQPPPKESLINWILRAQEIIESRDSIIKKSFLVAGIANTMGSSEENLIRDDSTYKEIQDIIDNVFGSTHMGYVEPHSSSVEEDPFANCTDSSDSSDTEEDEENVEDDPFASSSDSEAS